LCSVVVPRRGSLAEALEERGVPALPLEVGPWCSSAPLPAETAFESMHRSYYRLRFFLPELERLSPDLFLTDTAAVPWGAVAALLLDRPHVWMIRELGDLDPGPFYPLGRLVDTIREASNHLVVGSEALRSALFPGMDPSQCSVAYPAHIDLPALEGTRPAVSRLPDSTKLFIADPIPPGNGLEDALGAAAELIRLGYRLELCLAGGENEGDAAELKALGEREGLTPFIHDIGPASDARAFLQQADIGLSCSPSPGLGRAVIEALLLGKPVVCSDTGGAAELIADGVSGLVYSPGDREQLVEKLRFFLDHPERIRQFGDRARQDLFSKLSRHADDQVIAQIGLALVGQPNPYSSHLLRLMLDWEHGESEAQYREQIEGLTQRARRAETLAAARERELKDIRRTRAWRIAQFCWKVRARLFPGGSARKEGRN
jgi:glycosyltransferase involved in cell wall biosynthesis